MKPLRKLGLISAMREEQSDMKSLLQHLRLSQVASREFVEGEYIGCDGYKLSLVCTLSGIGKVAAATTAATLIERFGCDALLFTGLAGGLGEGVKVGDVVIGLSLLQHDMDASPLFPKYELPLRGAAALSTHEALTRVLYQSAAMLQTQLLQPMQIHQGLIVSGDRFVSTAEESHALRTALRRAGHEALCVEMEGAAVAQVCSDYQLPFAISRIISDRADDDAQSDFMSFLRSTGSRYSHALIAHSLNQLCCEASC